MDAFDCDLCATAELIKIQPVNRSVPHAHSQKKILHGLAKVFSAKVNSQDLLLFPLQEHLINSLSASHSAAPLLHWRSRNLYK